jgi:aspartate aminotransferase-like enzyme
MSHAGDAPQGVNRLRVGHMGYVDCQSRNSLQSALRRCVKVQRRRAWVNASQSYRVQNEQ